MEGTVTIDLEEFLQLKSEAETARKIHESIKHLTPKVRIESNPMTMQHENSYRVYKGSSNAIADAHFWLASVLQDLGIKMEEIK